MKFNSLMDAIREEYPVKFINTGTDEFISEIAFLDGSQKPYQDNTIYFGYYAQINPDKMPPHSVLTGYEDAANARGNVCFVEEEHFFSLFNSIKNLVLNNPGIPEIIAQIRAEPASGRDLRSFINFCSTKLTNSLIVLDANYKIIENSTIFPVTDKLWVDNLKRGYCTYAFTSEVARIFSAIKPPDTAEAFVVTCYASPLRKLCSKIYAGGKQVGTVILLEQESAISPLHLECLPHVSRILGETSFRDKAFIELESSQYDDLLYDLVIGAEPEDVRGRILASGMRFPETMCALCVCNSRYLGGNHMLTHVRTKLKELLPNIHMSPHEGSIAVLAPINGGFNLPAEQYKALESFAEDEFLCIGISNSFSRIENFPKYYRQAESAIKLGERVNGVSSLSLYERYSFYDMLKSVEGGGLGRYCHPALMRLNQYDQKHGTQLYKTLRVYLDNAGNSKNTADALFIHRNTLNYRLSRVLEVAAIDIDDSEMRFMLSASYRIDKFIGMDG